MKAAVLLEAFDKQGRSMIAIWSAVRTIYRRRDGSFYWLNEGRRQTVTQQANGDFYLALHQ